MKLFSKASVIAEDIESIHGVTDGVPFTVDSIHTKADGEIWSAGIKDSLDLFEGGFTGGLIEFKPEYMYSDAGTTPSVLDGPVQAIMNRVTNAVAQQTDPTRQGLMKADGVLTDGVDDFYPSGISGGSMGRKMTMLICVTVDNPNGGILVGSNAGSGSSRLWFNSSTAGLPRRRYGSVEANFGSDIRALGKVTMGVSLDRDAPQYKTFFNGAVVEEAALDFDPSTFGQNIGATNNAGNPGSWSRALLHGYMIINRVLTSAEVRSLHKYWTA